MVKNPKISLGDRSLVGTAVFKAMNWLPTKERFDLSVFVKTFTIIYQPLHTYPKCIFR